MRFFFLRYHSWINFKLILYSLHTVPSTERSNSHFWLLIHTFVSDPVKVIKDLLISVTTQSRLKVTLSRSEFLRSLTVDEADVVQSSVLPIPLVVLHSFEGYLEVLQSSYLDLTVVPLSAVISVNTPDFLERERSEMLIKGT